MNATPSVALQGLVGAQAAAWDALLDVAPDLGDHWTLIGGQMVALHQAERNTYASDDSRPSFDVDVVVNIRSGHRNTACFDEALRAHGFEQVAADMEHRYRREADGVVFDVLAPDHLGIHFPRLGRGHTLKVAGGTQALKRTDWVSVTHGTRHAHIARPNLVGALLIKIAAAASPPGSRGSGRHQQDIVTLTRMLRETDITTASLTKNERKRIQRAAAAIATHDNHEVTAVASRLQQLAN